MDCAASDLRRLSSSNNSLRGSWKNNGMEVFSRSAHDQEDDEEALRWAALQRLPTYNRLRKGILVTGSRGISHEVEIHDLGLQQQKKLLDKLVPDVEEDNEKFLRQLKNRLERVGIDIPKIEVRFEHISVEAEAYVGSTTLPTFSNFVANIFLGTLNNLHVLSSRKKHLKILHDVSGIIKPNRTTLLLGPPSSGKTTLLLALAGKLDKDLQVEGRVAYNGHEMHEFVPQRTAAYISQRDVHSGELTVRETLSYSARFQGVGYRYEMLAELSRREKEASIKPDPDIDLFMKLQATTAHGKEDSVVVNYILKVLGLENCADTLVGDQMIRGISGGQRKRVTTGEMLVGPANALFMDEISTGLDSTTTYQTIKMLRQYVHILNGTALISLLQPTPETYELFDDIILLSDGLIVYQGPRENVLEFFEHMGFRCPKRKGVSDFLLEVTSEKDQQQYWVPRDEPYRFLSATEFCEEFQSFHVAQKLGDQLATPFDRSKNHPAALTTKKFGVGKREMFRACFSREWLLMKRTSFIYKVKITQLVMAAVIAMTVFLKTKMKKDVDGGIIYAGSIFYAVTLFMLFSRAEITWTVVKLPLFYKHRDLLFFPSWAYALPNCLLKVPLTIMDAAIWVFTTYYVIGYDPNFGRLLKQLLLLALVSQAAFALFRFVGAAGRNLIFANTIGTLIWLELFALGGAVMSRNAVRKWWLWGYWTSPLMYAQNALIANEFLGKSWSKIPVGAKEPVGVMVMNSLGYFPHAYWCWIGTAALIGYIIFFNILYTLALKYLNPHIQHQPIIPKETDIDRKRGTSIHLPNQGSAFDGKITGTGKRKGMLLPYEQHSITFDEVRYSIDMPRAMKDQGVTEDRLVLLNGVSGTFRPGVLTALMGVSGAGKTTMMDVLAGRKTGGYIEGDIRISGYPKKQATFARISGYCEQNDIHSPNVTVYESLIYSAWLRLSPDVDSETRKMFVEEVMDLVELIPLRSALVGLPGVSGLSTEQRKRLTVAVELVANPSIIFMDEPTSGLDARAAAIVMRTVRNTVDTGRTVVCTIHQPSIAIFEAFDELLLLKRGGREIYVGPLGWQSCQMINYFESIEGIPKIKDGYNPATWMLEITTPARELALGVDFTELFRKSDLCRQNKALIQELSTPGPNSEDLHFANKYAQPFFTQCIACLWKQYWSYWRNPSYTAVRFIFTTVLAVMFGSIFWDLGRKYQSREDLSNAMGSMYAATLFLGFLYTTMVQPVVAIERTVVYRERAAGMYSAWANAFAQVLIEVPYTFVQSTVYSIIIYAMIGFKWSAAKFFWYLFFMFISMLYFTYSGMMTVALTPNPHLAYIIVAAFYSIWNLFSGFIIPLSRIPIWWRWFYWSCPLAWTYYGLVASQFGDIKQMMPDQNQTVEQFMRSYFCFRHDFLGVVAGVTVGLATLFALIFAASTRAFNFQKR
ncbi:hypothetical protein Drorol1_Dr00005588 [Drosera rotundifolia]